MKYFNLTGLSSPLENDMRTIEKHLNRLDDMILKADALLSQINGSTDVSESLTVTADHMEVILGDLNYERVKISETFGPIVYKNP